MRPEKVALVTGGTGGLGKAIVHSLAEEYQVVFLYRSNQEEANKIQLQYKNAEGWKADISNYEELSKTVDEIVKKHGRIDVLVNNAGIVDDGLFMLMTNKNWEKVINTNLIGTMNVTNLVLPFLIERRKGSIINISSVAGISGQDGQCNYSASKAGIIGFTKALAKEVAQKGIRVNVIAPGYIKTEMTDKMNPKRLEKEIGRIPMKKMGNPEDVAAGVFFLSGDGANYITGQTLVIDGGLT